MSIETVNQSKLRPIIMRGALTPISGRPDGNRHKNMFTGDLTELLLWVRNGLHLRADSGFITDDVKCSGSLFCTEITVAQSGSLLSS